MKEKASQQDKIKEILEVIVGYAQLNFSQKVLIEDYSDDLAALGTGVNMLGEEMQARVSSLHEKEVLLREVHHRVKNNLQIISSFINLQVEKEDNQRLRHFAKQSQSRIKTIALIHEMLYRSPDFRYSNFSEYVNRLIEMLSKTFLPEESEIEFDLDVDPEMYFNIDQLIPIGLIINETVSNSIKHAFPNNKGEVRIVAGFNEKDHFLRISDNGIGMDIEAEMRGDGTSIGIELIKILAEQIDMRMNVENHIGVTYHLTF